MILKITFDASYKKIPSMLRRLHFHFFEKSFGTKKRNWKIVGHQNLGSFYSIIKGSEAFGIILDCGERRIFPKQKQVTATSSAIFGVK